MISFVKVATSKELVKDALKRVQKIDLSTIANSLIFRKQDMTLSVDDLTSIYSKWLALRAVYGRNVPPPNSEIDAMWHEHILHTNQYFSDCEYLFGEYMHHHVHKSSRAIESDLDRFEKMTELWRQHYHETIIFSDRLVCH